MFGATPISDSALVGAYIRLGIALDFRFDPFVVGARLAGARNLYLGAGDAEVPPRLRDDAFLGVHIAFAW